jgi:signal transduction histidine kinase/CheY-like chemotaxis protein
MTQSAITHVTEREIERLIAALHHHVEEGISPETLRHLTKELERRTLAERRCAELFESEQLARAEARELEQANEAKDRFLAILSHELRTPLQPVISAASALLRDPRLPADLLEDVRTIQRNVQLEARLIDDLLDLTRIVNGKLGLERQAVNIESVVARAIDICEPDLMGKRQTLSLKLNAQHKWVFADPGRLQQVLWNLIKNAVKFTPAGGEIVIETLDFGGDGGGGDGADGDSRVMVRVVDNGIGIHPEALPRIFDAFEQGSDAVTRKHGGMGLGLAICKLLVERHEGTLAAQSEGEGRGATFTLALPLAEPPPAAAAGRRGTYTTPPDHQRLRILLVEDDQDSNYVMTKLLTNVGHEVVSAVDCASALVRAVEGEYDIIVCDLGLPDGSGLDVMTNLRARGNAIRGIALTGYGSDNDILASLAAGFDVHLTKPVTTEQLVQAMNKLIPG